VELAFGPISTASNSTPSYRCRLVALASVLNFEIGNCLLGHARH